MPANRFGNVFKKSDHIVVRSLFYLQNFGNRKSRSLANFRSVLLWDLAKIRHRLAGQHLNLQPDLKLALVRPDFAHLRPGITIDHSRKINGLTRRKKRFVFGVAAL